MTWDGMGSHAAAAGGLVALLQRLGSGVMCSQPVAMVRVPLQCRLWSACTPHASLPALTLPVHSAVPACCAVPPQGVRASLVPSSRMQQGQQQQQGGPGSYPGRCALSLSLDRMHSAPVPGAMGSLPLSAPAAAEAALAAAAEAAAMAAAAPPPASGPAATASGAGRQPTVEELQRQLRDTQQQLAALVALQATAAGAPPAAAAINGRSASGSVESGSPERLSSGEAEQPRLPTQACGAGLRSAKAASSPAMSVEAVRASD